MRKADALVRLGLSGCLGAAGCATGRAADLPMDQINWAEATHVPTAPPPEPAEEEHAPAVLTRQVLRDAAGRGLGRFLAQVDVSPVVANGRFAGFRLNGAVHLRRWRRAGMDLLPGDIIVRVNGHDIDRPERAAACLEALRDASDLRIDLVRRGTPMTVHADVSDASVRSAP